MPEGNYNTRPTSIRFFFFHSDRESKWFFQVLGLWLERKILPESLLRRYMDDIVVPNDDMSAGFLLRRPSRAERSVDDPIREMEDMVVDEYGR